MDLMREAQARPSGLGVGGFVCGVLAVIFSFVPVLGLFFGPVLGICAIVFGAVGRSISKKRGAPTGLATAGVVCGAIALAIMVVYVLAIASTF